MIFSKKISVLLVAALCLAMGATPAMAANQKDEGRAGVPTLGTDKNGKIIVPKTLDDVPGEYCPAEDPNGWDHTTKRKKSWNGFACSQEFLSISGNNITLGLFDKDWGDNTIAPGAKDLAYDMLYALAETKINQGVDNPSAWGTVNQISQKLHGANAKGPNTSSVQGFLGKYDDPAMAIFFDTINRCGCVMQVNWDKNDPDQNLLKDGKLEKGCPGAQLACASASPNITGEGTWGPKNVYNKSFQDLSKSCIYMWNTLLNNTYNAKNGITDPNDANYTQICDPMMGGECTICTVSTALKNNYSNLPDRLFCDGSTFVGPGLISYSGKDRNGNMIQNPILVSFDGNTCGDNTGKVDIVAQ